VELRLIGRLSQTRANTSPDRTVSQDSAGDSHGELFEWPRVDRILHPSPREEESRPTRVRLNLDSDPVLHAPDHERSSSATARLAARVDIGGCWRERYRPLRSSDVAIGGGRSRGGAPDVRQKEDWQEGQAGDRRQVDPSPDGAPAEYA